MVMTLKETIKVTLYAMLYVTLKVTLDVIKKGDTYCHTTDGDTWDIKGCSRHKSNGYPKGDAKYNS